MQAQRIPPNPLRYQCFLVGPVKYKGTLEIEMQIMCTTPAQVLESLSGMFGNATDTDGNATKQMMMKMMEQQNITEQELKEEMNSLACMPMTDENMTQSLMQGAIMQ